MREYCGGLGPEKPPKTEEQVGVKHDEDEVSGILMVE